MTKFRRYIRPITIRLSEEQYKWLASRAKQNRFSIAEVIRNIITEAMKNEQAEK
ncbi:MAG: hypothetical protein QXL06_01975 [Nitrososphaerota archaeon]